jgi:dolichyl-phosphate-mannose-protein mannosyltransferase
MFSLAFALRLLIAPRAGFLPDLNLFRTWTMRLGDVGLDRFYAAGVFADYPPGYMYVLWLISKLSATPGYVLLKTPAILGDLGLAWIAGIWATRIAPDSLNERLPVRMLVSAAVLFNPAIILDSAVWGQVEAVPAFFILWSLFLLFTGPQGLRREIPAFLLYAVAVAIKPQSALVLPVMLYALYRRYLSPRTPFDLAQAAKAALLGVLPLSLWSVSGLPFGLGPVELLRLYHQSAAVYPVTSAGAFNLWGAVGFWRPDSPESADFVAVAAVPALYVGMGLLAGGAALVLWRVHRAIERGSHEGRTLTVAAALTALLAFALLTRMHERYLFYPLVLIAPLIHIRPFRLAYAGLSSLFVLNLWWMYAWPSSTANGCTLAAPGCLGFDSIFGGYALDAWQRKVWSAAVVAIAIAVAWVGSRSEPGTRRRVALRE